MQPRRALFVPVAVLSLLLAACGGGDESTGATSPDAEPTAAETAATAPTDAEAPSGPVSVSFEQPQDGSETTSPVQLRMQATGVRIMPAGDATDDGGHFHVMVDTPCVEPGQPIPNDDSHVHFGDGSSSGELELEPGAHELCLQLGDGQHIATGLTDEVSVQVTG